MAGLPYAKFYWSDWAADANLRTCTFAAQGFWMRLLCIAAESTQVGFVLLNGQNPTDEDLSKVTGATLEEVVSLREELLKKGVASVDRRSVLYNRRMVNAEIKRSRSAAGGKIGGPLSLEMQKGIHTTRGATRYPYSKPEARSQSPESRVLYAERLCSELGIEFSPIGNMANWPHLIERMVLEDGLDFEADILAAVRAEISTGRLVAANIKTPGFFRAAAQHFHDQRAKGAKGTPVATVHSAGLKLETMTRSLWQQRLVRFLECGVWIGPGPDPTCSACLAPADLLEACRERWSALGNHPEYQDTDCNFPWKAKPAQMRGCMWPVPKPVDDEPMAVRA